MSCVSVVVQSWPTAGPFHQADRKQESQGVHDHFFFKCIFMLCKIWIEALWQITHHVNGLRGVCGCIMYVCLYCTSLIVLHSVKYCSEQAVEQEVAQCVLFSMGDDIHLRLVKAVIQKSPEPSFRNAFSFVFPQTCAVQHKIWRTSLCTTGKESHR